MSFPRSGSVQQNVKSIVIPADITNEEDRKLIVERAEKELGNVDILVNNAAIESVAHFVQQPEIISRTIETNLKAPILLTRLIVPKMLQQKSGHIVTISSLAGKIYAPNSSIYSATKAGLIAWSLSLRSEFKNHGIGFSVISPGLVSNSGMFADYERHRKSKYKVSKLTGKVSPDMVAKAVIRSIKNDIEEIMVTPGPVRILFAFITLFPRLRNTVLTRMGLNTLYYQMADDQKKISN